MDKLYIELLTEKHVKDPESPTGQAIQMISSGTCAVIDEEALDEQIYKLQKLKHLRKMAREHNVMIREEVLQKLGVKYTIKPLIKKRC